MRVLVTRPQPAADATARRLERLGHAPVVVPLFAVAATGAIIPAGPFDAVAATSANAFLGMDGGVPPGLAAVPLHAVGGRTAAAARQAGFRAVVEAEGDAGSLARVLRGQVPPGGRVLYLAGRERKPLLEAELAGAGLAVEPVEVYGTQPMRADPLGGFGDAGEGAVLHFSRRAAEALVASARTHGHEAAMVCLPHLCLSSDVAAPLLAAGASRVLVADRPDEESLLALLDTVGSRPRDR